MMLSDALRQKYAEHRKMRERDRTLRARFSTGAQFGRNRAGAYDPAKQQEYADTIIDEGPYIGRVHLDQTILAGVHLAIEENLCPDWWKHEAEGDRLTAVWYVYSQNLNL